MSTPLCVIYAKIYFVGKLKVIKILYMSFAFTIEYMGDYIRLLCREMFLWIQLLEAVLCVSYCSFVAVIIWNTVFRILYD